LTTHIDLQRPVDRAIAWGIQAPNPHNTQAWKFHPLSDTSALLYLDQRRLLPVTDPRARQIHIGAGCCIETLAVGMSTEGYETDVELLPDGPHRLEDIGRKPVAKVDLRPGRGNRPDELADAIGRRRTNRRPYTGPLLTSAEADQIRSQVPPGPVEALTFNEPDAMRPLLDIFYRALEIEVTSTRLYEETRIWFRFNERQRRTHRDGLSMPQMGVDGLKGRLVEWTLRNGDPRRWFARRTLDSTLSTLRQGIDSARGIVLLKTPTNRQTDWLDAGRAFARVQLRLTQLGLACNPYSQALQEFPEMTALQHELDDLVAARDPQKIQMAVRVGRARSAYAAPRRDPGDFIVDSPATDPALRPASPTGAYSPRSHPA
jgi:nitroreductase